MFFRLLLTDALEISELEKHDMDCVFIEPPDPIDSNADSADEDGGVPPTEIIFSNSSEDIMDKEVDGEDDNVP